MGKAIALRTRNGYSGLADAGPDTKAHRRADAGPLRPDVRHDGAPRGGRGRAPQVAATTVRRGTSKKVREEDWEYVVVVIEMENKTRRLSDNFLDLDLLDERARKVLGMARADEIIIN